MHQERHPLAGRTVRLKMPKEATGALTDGVEFRIEDWQDRVFGKSWMVCDGNPAAMIYGMRSGFAGLPTDDDVVYGKVGAFGHIVHASELGDTIK